LLQHTQPPRKNYPLPKSAPSFAQELFISLLIECDGKPAALWQTAAFAPHSGQETLPDRALRQMFSRDLPVALKHKFG
jgi:hypothetical protein